MADRTFPLGVFILICCVALFSFGAGKLSLQFKGDENFYFESAHDMLESGDVLTPYYRGSERFQKPPLFYWFILASFKIFGVNWFSARLPSIIFGALCALLIFALSNLFFEEKRIGLFAALFAATTPLFYRYAKIAVPDMALLFFITGALYCFARVYKKRGAPLYSALFFLAMALAFLTKGPVGLFIPLLTAGIFCLVKKEKKLFRTADIFIGIFVFLIIAAPWFYQMYRIHGDEYFRQVWNREVLYRLGKWHSVSLITNYLKGFFYYLGALVTKFLPFSLFLPAALISSARNKERLGEKDAHLFFILLLAVVFFFFTFIPERHSHYLLPLLPALSVLTAARFRRSRFLPPGLVLSLILIYAAISISPPMGLLTNKMERAGQTIKSELKAGDRIGIGSHGIIPEELQAYFERPVENVKITYNDDGTPDAYRLSALLGFLRSKGRIFCVIKKKDFDRSVPEEIKRDMRILNRYYVWKRRIRFSDALSDLHTDTGLGSFRKIFQNEIYVISNRR